MVDAKTVRPPYLHHTHQYHVSNTNFEPHRLPLAPSYYVDQSGQARP